MSRSKICDSDCSTDEHDRPLAFVLETGARLVLATLTAGAVDLVVRVDRERHACSHLTAPEKTKSARARARADVRRVLSRHGIPAGERRE